MAMITKTCAECGTPFEALDSHYKYCGPACRRIVRTRNEVIRATALRVEARTAGVRLTCKRCGSSFKPRHVNSQYCNSPDACAKRVLRLVPKAEPTEVLLEVQPDKCRGCGGRMVVRPLPFHDQRLCTYCNTEHNSRKNVAVGLMDR